MNNMSSVTNAQASQQAQSLHNAAQATFSTTLTDILTTAMKVAAIFFAAAVCKSIMSIPLNEIFEKLTKISANLAKFGDASSKMTELADNIINEASSISTPIERAVLQLSPAQQAQNPQLISVKA